MNQCMWLLCRLVNPRQLSPVSFTRTIACDFSVDLSIQHNRHQYLSQEPLYVTSLSTCQSKTIVTSIFHKNHCLWLLCRLVNPRQSSPVPITRTIVCDFSVDLSIQHNRHQYLSQEPLFVTSLSTCQSKTIVTSTYHKNHCLWLLCGLVNPTQSSPVPITRTIVCDFSVDLSIQDNRHQYLSQEPLFVTSLSTCQSKTIVTSTYHKNHCLWLLCRLVNPRQLSPVPITRTIVCDFSVALSIQDNRHQYLSQEPLFVTSLSTCQSKTIVTSTYHKNHCMWLLCRLVNPRQSSPVPITRTTVCDFSVDLSIQDNRHQYLSQEPSFVTSLSTCQSNTIVTSTYHKNHCLWLLCRLVNPTQSSPVPITRTIVCDFSVDLSIQDNCHQYLSQEPLFVTSLSTCQSKTIVTSTYHKNHCLWLLCRLVNPTQSSPVPITRTIVCDFSVDLSIQDNRHQYLSQEPLFVTSLSTCQSKTIVTSTYHKNHCLWLLCRLVNPRQSSPVPITRTTVCDFSVALSIQDNQHQYLSQRLWIVHVYMTKWLCNPLIYSPAHKAKFCDTWRHELHMGRALNATVHIPFSNNRLSLNTLLYRYSFSRINNRQLLKTLWEKKKLLVTSNFFFSHNVF